MTFAIFVPIEQSPAFKATTNLPTCPTADAAFPASKLAGLDPTDVFRSTASPAVITWDYGENRLVNCVAVLSPDMDSAGTILIETSVNGSTWTSRSNKAFWAHITTAVTLATQAETADPLGRYNHKNFAFWFTETAISVRYVRITVTRALPWSLSRMFVGRAFMPASRYQYGSSFEFYDTGTKDRTDRGAPVMDVGFSLVNAKIKLDFLTKNDMLQYMYDLNHWRQSTRELLVCLDVADQANLQRNLIYGTLSMGRSISFDSFEKYSQELVVEGL